MQFKKLAALIFRELKSKMKRHNGLSVFAKKRSKFESWLKVELIDSLLNRFDNVCPEKNRVDVVFDSWAIELKTINTNYRYRGVNNHARPITENIHGVIEDIKKIKKKIKKLRVKNRTVLFIVFPVKHDKKEWQVQLQRIKKYLTRIEFRHFDFKNNRIPGVIYFGKIK